MKKEYKNPAVSVLNVKTQLPLAGSVQFGETTNQTSGNLAPRHNDLYGGQDLERIK